MVIAEDLFLPLIDDDRVRIRPAAIPISGRVAPSGSRGE